MHVWALGLSCEAPAALRPPGLHTTTRELQTWPQRFQTPPKFHEKTLKREKKERKLWREKGKKARNVGPPTLRGPHPSGPHPSRELCLPTTEDGRVGVVRGWREDFGPSRTNLCEFFFWPKSNKGPIGLSRIGLSRMGLSRAHPLHCTKLLHVEKLFAVLQCAMLFLIFCANTDFVSVVDPCCRQHRVYLRWPQTFLNAVFSLGGWPIAGLDICGSRICIVVSAAASWLRLISGRLLLALAFC